MPTKPDNNRWLLRFMKEHDLNRQDIADAVCVTKVAVDRWCLPPPKRGMKPDNSYRKMPDMAKKLLEYVAMNGEFDRA